MYQVTLAYIGIISILSLATLYIIYNYNLFMAHNLKFKNLSLKKDFQVALSDLWFLNKPSSEGYSVSTIIVQHFTSVQFSSWFLNMLAVGWLTVDYSIKIFEWSMLWNLKQFTFTFTY